MITKIMEKMTYIWPYISYTSYKVSFHNNHHLLIYTCGPSTRFFLRKSIGFFFKFLLRMTNHNCDARNKDEYVPATSPTTNAMANPKMDCAPKTRKAKTAINVVVVVLILRINVCIKL